MLRSPSRTRSRRFGVKSIPWRRSSRRKSPGCSFSGFVRPHGVLDASDQTAFGCDLNGAMAEHLDRVPAFSGASLQYGDNRASGMITEGLIYLVTNCEFGRQLNLPASRRCIVDPMPISKVNFAWGLEVPEGLALRSNPTERGAPALLWNSVVGANWFDKPAWRRSSGRMFVPRPLSSGPLDRGRYCLFSLRSPS